MGNRGFYYSTGNTGTFLEIRKIQEQNEERKQMILIVCLDNQNGIAFHHRRQSSDRAVTEDIAKTAAESGQKLYISPYSRSLFAKEENNESELLVCENPLVAAREGDCIFLEQNAADLSEPAVEALIVYRWNRDYPSDVKLTIGEEWELVESADFPGHSHGKITKEQYRRSSSCQK